MKQTTILICAACALGCCTISRFAQAQERKLDGVKLDEATIELIKAGRFAEAERHVQISKVTEDPAFLAWLAIKNGRKSEGLESLKRHFMTDASESDVGIQRILTVLADASPEDAVEFANTCVNEGQGNPSRVKFKLVAILLKVRNGYSEAAKLFDDAAAARNEVGEEFKVAAYSLAMYEYQNNMPKNAIRHFDVLFDARPDVALLPEYRTQWAHVARRSGKELEALKELDKVQNDHPETYNRLEGHVLLSRGLAFESMGNLNEARREMTRVVELAASNPQFTAVGKVAKSKLKEWDDNELGSAPPSQSSDSTSRDIAPTGKDAGGRWFLVYANIVILTALAAAWWIRHRRR